MNADKLTLLKKLIDGRLKTLEAWKSRYSFSATNLSIAVAVFAAINTFSIAMAQFRGQDWNILALFVSGIVTVLSAVEASTKPRQRYFHNAEALNEIYDIKARLNWREQDKSHPLIDEEIDSFFKEFRKVEKSFFTNIYSIDSENLQTAAQSPENWATANDKIALETKVAESQDKQ